ncbi:Caffeic acid 3-O-methyltransferase [Hibiscus syriacus]|uniref:Caffeic acid 3-O-methyltransferase n=1 Tax=Hibiscus syriacus TaxID=106335 RepID=A0A6A2WEV3_HIBSY|nr:Caffeic acid 3-O-methyltransferase [Hibiscus syriacus]
MKNHTTLVMRNILNTYKGFADLDQVIVDDGTGLGVSLSFITSNVAHVSAWSNSAGHIRDHSQSWSRCHALPKEIAAQLTTVNPETPSMLDRILRVLASHAIVGCSMADDADEEGNPQRLYALTPVSRFFVRNEDGVSLGPLMSMVQGKVLNFISIRFTKIWPGNSMMGRSQLKDAILEGGIPFDRVHGMNSFDYPGKDPSFNQLFNTAMKNITTLVMKNILDAYKGFTDHLGQVIVDVGGCLGVSLSFITSKYPSIKGINYDLPHVIQHAPPIPGVEHVAGDMFQNVPKGDAILLSDQHCLKMKNCYNAIPNDGKVIVVDYVVPVVPETNAQERYTSQLSVLMMTQNPGGKERTKQEFQALASKAGF